MTSVFLWFTVSHVNHSHYTERRWWGAAENCYSSLDSWRNEALERRSGNTRPESRQALSDVQTFSSLITFPFYIYAARSVLAFRTSTSSISVLPIIFAMPSNCRSFKGDSLGFSGGRVCWSHHADRGRNDQVTGSTFSSCLKKKKVFYSLLLCPLSPFHSKNMHRVDPEPVEDVNKVQLSLSFLLISLRITHRFVLYWSWQ